MSPGAKVVLALLGMVRIGHSEAPPVSRIRQPKPSKINLYDSD